MKKLYLVKWLALLVITILFSCSDDNKIESVKGIVNFQFKVESNLKSTLKSETENIPHSIYISIKDNANNYVCNLHKLPLIKIGDDYITEQIELVEGEYSVEDFIVVNDNDSSLYLTPKTGSEFEMLVDNPLPYYFEVSAKNITNQVLEVIPSDLGKPMNYGYATFSFTIVNTLDRGLIAYYPFDSTANDASGNENHGIEIGNSVYQKGMVNKAKDFDGTNDYIQLTNTLNGSKGLTFSFWLCTRGANGVENNGVIVGKYNMATDARCFLIYSFGMNATREDNRLYAAFYKYGSSANIHDHLQSYMEYGELSAYPDTSLWTIYNPQRLVQDNWTHCVINYTDTTVETWLDGKLCTTKKREHAEYFDSEDEPVYIGNIIQGGTGDNNHFNGLLDELRIYNRGLTEREILALYALKD